ncbi:hypothetical protein IC235_04800 [Hymenobacter sp. BT664]|uniref:Uncharacterized protein n=1 Tax=Hymenobacter montanus TaxID=2771359 RepID=A0A927BBS2_9BACT|nr:hypothetical protein [Hymenobacter montanus]MBD2767208.1 hypothetical protein [Hymenobacter montanus]
MLPRQGTDAQEYRTAKIARILIYVLIPPLTLLSLVMPFLLMQVKNPSLVVSSGFGVLGVGLAVFFIYGLIETVKGLIILNAREITQIGAFKIKTLLLQEIAGYRISAYYTHVFPKGPSLPTLKIGNTTERYRELQQWLAAQYPDLDQVDTDRAIAFILEDHNLGRTPEERAKALTQAKTTALILNIAGGVAGAWAIFYLPPYEWVIGACLLVPILATIALWRFPHTLRIDQKSNSGYPSLLIATLIPCLGLLIRALFDYQLPSYAPMWPLVGTAATGAALALAIGSRQFLFRACSRVSVALTIALLALLYGYGATSTINVVYDTAEGATFRTKVLGKHYTSGRNNNRTYYLKVSPWGPVTSAEDVRVSHDFYRQTQEGQAITIMLLPGRLGVPWFLVVE